MVGMCGGRDQPRHMWGLTLAQLLAYAHRVRGDHDHDIQDGLHTIQLPRAELRAGFPSTVARGEQSR